MPSVQREKDFHSHPHPLTAASLSSPLFKNLCSSFCGEMRTDKTVETVNFDIAEGQEQSFADVPQNKFSLKLNKFHSKTPVLEYLFNKVC